MNCAFHYGTLSVSGGTRDLSCPAVQRLCE